MDKIPLTNYQFIAYFLPGLTLVLSLFVTLQPVTDFSSLADCIKDITPAIGIVLLLSCFIAGLVLDTTRTAAVDIFIDKVLTKAKWFKGFRIEWSYLYPDAKHEVGYFYARYYSYYCFDINMIAAIVASMIFIDHWSILTHHWPVNVFGPIAAICLLADAGVLRMEMHNITKDTKATQSSEKDSNANVADPGASS